jgi:hypothetical protein
LTLQWKPARPSQKGSGHFRQVLFITIDFHNMGEISAAAPIFRRLRVCDLFPVTDSALKFQSDMQFEVFTDKNDRWRGEKSSEINQIKIFAFEWRNHQVGNDRFHNSALRFSVCDVAQGLSDHDPMSLNLNIAPLEPFNQTYRWTTSTQRAGCRLCEFHCV